ncbi:MAG TPA: hypothetical protein VLS90_08110, partial [Thermodesulfobacteriota bacterium]|nr:hypothetical protein [Thermodesulfobacteriota bacterium]
ALIFDLPLTAQERGGFMGVIDFLLSPPPRLRINRVGAILNDECFCTDSEGTASVPFAALNVSCIEVANGIKAANGPRPPP